MIRLLECMMPVVFGSRLFEGATTDTLGKAEGQAVTQAVNMLDDAGVLKDGRMDLLVPKKFALQVKREMDNIMNTLRNKMGNTKAEYSIEDAGTHFVCSYDDEKNYFDRQLCMQYVKGSGIDRADFYRRL